MERLYVWSIQRIARTNTSFKRYLFNYIDWSIRLNVIIGMRGVGKTTLILQHAKEHLPVNESVIYVSLDDVYFSANSLIDFAEQFVQRGGKFLLVDEVQKYEGWSREIKMIYDNFPDLKIVISGSSAIEILKGEGDLSRRAVIHKLHGMSFREFIDLKYQIPFPVLSLDEILQKTSEKSNAIYSVIKPIKYFEEYVKLGYYPFSIEDERNFSQRLMQVFNTILEVDIPAVNNVDYYAVLKMKKLLSIIAESVPFKPNVKKLSEQLNISRETLLKYLQLLSKADLISLIYSATKGVSALNKPEKIYLNNPNLAYMFSEKTTDVGNMRETFFFNQLHHFHKVEYPEKGDFLVDSKYLFEVGGRNKSIRQIAGINNAWIAADNIEVPVGNKIPLWIFGFLY